MDYPLISVIIPVYNTGKEALGIINDILKNSYQNTEIIVVDDGSKDDSLIKLKQIKDKRVFLYSKENGGASSARNYGIKKSTGKYIIFVDSDDDVKKNFICELYNAIKKPDTVLAATGVNYRKIKKETARSVYLDSFKMNKNEKMETFVLRSLLHDGRLYPVFNKIFDGEVIRKKSILFDESLKFAEDTKFVLDYLRSNRGMIKFVLEPLYAYNYGTATSSVKTLENEWGNWEIAYENLKNWVGDADLHQKILLKRVRLKWRLSWIRIKLKF